MLEMLPSGSDAEIVNVTVWPAVGLADVDRLDTVGGWFGFATTMVLLVLSLPPKLSVTFNVTVKVQGGLAHVNTWVTVWVVNV